MLIVLIVKYRYVGVYIVEGIETRYLKYKLIALLTTTGDTEVFSVVMKTLQKY